MWFRQRLFAVSATVLLAFSSQVGAVSRLDPDLPRYQKVRGVAGNLSSVGSDSLANLMTFWAEEFKYIYSNVNIQVQAAGSSTAPPALAEGTVNLGPMSRKMKRNELQAFEQRYGYAPTAVPVAIDALAVYVHADNPLVGLSLKQLDAIFSSNQDCGAEQPVESWGQLGLTGVWERRDLQLFGRNSVSGTYGYFKLKALCGGDFRNTVNEQPGSASVVQSVATSIGAIGYSGIGYRTASVRSVPLLHNGEYMDATAANAVSGNYPLARYLYIYVNKPPNQPLPLLEREFIKMVLSRTGQKAVVKDGYIPLPEKFIARQRALLDL